VILAPEISQLAAFFRAGSHFAHRHIFKYRLQRVKQVQIFSTRRVFVRADQHFLRFPRAARNQSHARLDQSDVSLRSGMNSCCMQN